MPAVWRREAEGDPAVATLRDVAGPGVPAAGRTAGRDHPVDDALGRDLVVGVPGRPVGLGQREDQAHQAVVEGRVVDRAGRLDQVVGPGGGVGEVGRIAGRGGQLQMEQDDPGGARIERGGVAGVGRPAAGVGVGEPVVAEVVVDGGRADPPGGMDRRGDRRVGFRPPHVASRYFLQG